MEVKRRFIVASHKDLAKGLMEAVEFILGSQPEVLIYGSYIDPEEKLDLTIEQLLKKYSQEDEIIVLTDILGGSVCNAFIRFLDRYNLHILSGMNLAMCLEVFIHQDLPLMELIELAVDSGRKAACYCNSIVKEMLGEGEL